METTTCDTKGRLYLKQAVRAKYGKRFVILEAADELVLLPVPDDPVEDLARMGKKLKNYSIKEMKAIIRNRLAEEALS